MRPDVASHALRIQQDASRPEYSVETSERGGSLADVADVIPMSEVVPDIIDGAVPRRMTPYR